MGSNPRFESLPGRKSCLCSGSSASKKPLSGNCWANVAGYGCKVYIQGPAKCVFSGNQIWWAHQDIRDSGCKKCGSKHIGDGCLISIDYDDSCDNRDKL